MNSRQNNDNNNNNVETTFIDCQEKLNLDGNSLTFIKDSLVLVCSRTSLAIVDLLSPREVLTSSLLGKI
jgi:hypothetical protein